MESDEGNFSGLPQNTFLPNRITLSIIASILESENGDFVDYKESTSANAGHAESTNKKNISLISDEELEKRKQSQIPFKHQT